MAWGAQGHLGLEPEAGVTSSTWEGFSRLVQGKGPPPSIYLANWGRPDLHGPGRQLSAMVFPREWERGQGRVPAAAPLPGKLLEVKAGRISIFDYLADFELEVTRRDLRPGCLLVTDGGRVTDGDSLLCSCSARSPSKQLGLFGLPPARDPCHLEVLAPAFALAGWRVILYGEELEVMGQEVRRGGDLYSWR